MRWMQRWKRETWERLRSSAGAAAPTALRQGQATAIPMHALHTVMYSTAQMKPAPPRPAQALFKTAIAGAALPSATPPAEDPACTTAAAVCYQWYPYAYVTGQLCRRAASALKHLGELVFSAKCLCLTSGTDEHKLLVLATHARASSQAAGSVCGPGSADLCGALLQEAAKHLGNGGGASVLRRYRRAFKTRPRSSMPYAQEACRDPDARVCVGMTAD